MTDPLPGVRRCALMMLLALCALPAWAEDAGPTVASAARAAIIPAPAQAQALAGEFVITAATPLHADGDAARAAAHHFQAWTGASLATPAATHASASASDGITFVLDPKADPAAESYQLEVTPQHVRVSASQASGLFYGAVSLWQLATPAADGSLRVAATRITDAPRFGWRGFMLDSARHFWSVDEIKQLLDAMALHKLNTFHWHLTDDQGWRIEIKKYPKLTGIGSCRTPAGDAGRDAAGQPVNYCGYYSQAQIREVVRHAAERHITVLPEIDVPGHAQAAIAAYPELGVLGTRPAVSNQWGVHSYLFNTEESTFRFLEDVLTEVMALFPGRYVHVGADEAVKDQWQASARVQARMRELGVADEFHMQSHIIKRLETFLEAHDRRLIGWDEILEGGLPPEATVMSWRGTEGGLEAARQGHDVVMTPKSHLYLDYLQTGSTDEPPGRPAQVTLAQVYGFEPVPDALDASLRHHILGLQANLWTEHTRTVARLHHHLFPRLAALAEVGWTPVARKDYADFLQRLPAQLQRYQALGLGYAQTPFQVIIGAPSGDGDHAARVELQNPLGYAVRYTLDGSAPSAGSPLYQQPLSLPVPTTLRAAAFFDGRALAPANTRRIDAASLLSRNDDELDTCPEAGRLLLRLEDDGPREGERALFNVTIFNPCWRWVDAPLREVARVQVRAGRIPYYFQLAHDEKNRRFEPAASAHGELLLRTGDCQGEPVARVPLPAQPGADGFVDLQVALPASARQAQALCINFSGDTRPTMWVLDQVRLVRDE